MFCISTKGRYATRILVLLASPRGDRLCTKNEIAELEELTPGYVQQLMSLLQAGGLVISYRGKQGGFRLARSPDSITVGDALRVTEGAVRLCPCHDGQNCKRIATCPTRSTWVEAAELLGAFFDRTTIAELAERGERMSQEPTLELSAQRE